QRLVRARFARDRLRRRGVITVAAEHANTGIDQRVARRAAAREASTEATRRSAAGSRVVARLRARAACRLPPVHSFILNVRLILSNVRLRKRPRGGERIRAPRDSDGMSSERE